MLAKLHAKLGDFWWYSLMLFCACRAADLLNAFVGLWLVPKYVDPSELGAVMPLTQFANFLAIPIAAFANTFRNEISRLSSEKEFGKLKTLLRGVFIATGIFLFAAIIVARFTLPVFLERIRIIEGSLGMIIIAASFISAVAPIYSNALQALKKFKEQSLISVIGAPVRLLTMLATMPFRAISGYFIGQASAPSFNIIVSIFCLRKELSASTEPYWAQETFKKFSTLFLIFLIWGTTSGFYGLVESTVIRQRLPDLDSAGYYMATRFSEIATYLYGAMIFAFFPYAADLAQKGSNRLNFIFKATGINIAFCAAVAVLFCFIAKPILSILPYGEQYASYWWAIPWLIAIAGISSLYGFFTTAEIAANRFGFLKWIIPIDIAYPTLLLMLSNHRYFADMLPVSLADFLARHNIFSLEIVLWWMTAINVIKAIVCLITMMKAKSHESILQ